MNEKYLLSTISSLLLAKGVIPFFSGSVKQLKWLNEGE